MNIMGIKDLTNIPILTPVEPIVEVDGGYCVCHRCHCEVIPYDRICPKCKQVQDWSWFRRKLNDK